VTAEPYRAHSGAQTDWPAFAKALLDPDSEHVTCDADLIPHLRAVDCVNPRGLGR
jgi:hypothetical protein